jgi:hypothetical protein
VRGKVARRFAVEDACQLYLELGSTARVASAMGICKDRIQEAVKPLIPQVRAMTRTMAIVTSHAESVERKKLAGVRWRCDCGCLVLGEVCHNGHAAPWAA